MTTGGGSGGSSTNGNGKCTFGFLPDGVTTSMVGPPDSLSGRRSISVPSPSAFRKVSPRGGKSRVLVSQSQKFFNSSGVSTSRTGLFTPGRNCRNASRTSFNVRGGGRSCHGVSGSGSGVGAGSCFQ